GGPRVSVPAPARAGGADRPVVGGANRAVHGDGHARDNADRSVGAHSGRALGRTGLPRAAGASSPAVGFAAQAADRLGGPHRTAQETWRRPDPARPRPHQFHHVVRWARWKNSLDWRAGGLGLGARTASGGGV